MLSKKKETIYLVASLGGFFVFSVSFLLMPIETDEIVQGLNTVTWVSGIMFWVGLLLGVIFQITLTRSRKNWFSRNRVRFPLSNQPKIGLFSFFRNMTAIVFDAIMILSLVGLIIAIAFTNATGYVCYIFIALLSFSFCAHCIFNGKNYYFIKNKESIKGAIEKAKANANG